jgi:hypothetical protein
METIQDIVYLSEKWFGVRITRVLRWFLFLPVSIAYGVIFFGIVCLGATSARDYFGDDVMLGGIILALCAAAIAGYQTIFIAVTIVPAFSRATAFLTWMISLTIACTAVTWALHKTDTVTTIFLVIYITLYALSSTVAAIINVFLRQHKKDQV